MGTGVTGSNPVMLNAGVAGNSTKSPASSVMAFSPSTARRQRPSSTTQKLGWPNGVYRMPQRPAPLIAFAKTVLGRSNAMTSDSGSGTAGLLIMHFGLFIVVRPICGGYCRSNSTTHQEIAMKTVLITGCSSGYGLEIARYFHEQGWNVVATMRTPRPQVLPSSNRMHVIALDVTKPDSIAAVLQSSG